MQALKAGLLATVGFCLSAAVQSLGGYDEFLHTLLILMIIDLITGWLVAAVFKNSVKTESGKLTSQACFQGLLKKGCTLLMVVVAVLLDTLIETHGFTRDAVIIAFSVNELISILENMGLMGIKLPQPLLNALEILDKEHPRNR